MRKRLLLPIICGILIIGTVTILNIEVSTHKGIDYKWSSFKIPLYLKVLDFFDRHYNYKQLMKNIIEDRDDKERRVIKIFAWVCQNIKRQPPDLPVIDDHVWYIIVRGYGASDQFNDVFTTLCNYAGIEAFYVLAQPKDRSGTLFLSFVKLNKKWNIFDPYNGVYFKNSSGKIASIEQIRRGDWKAFNFMAISKQNADYAKYLENIPAVNNMGLNRANIQSPLKRLEFEFKKWIKKE